MNSSTNLKIKGFILMFLSSSFMGGVGALARNVDAGGEVVSFFRNFVGFIGAFCILLLIKRAYALKETKITIAVVLSGVFLGLLSMLYVMSTKATTLSNAAFLIYTGPIYSTVLASIFLKEKFTKATVISLFSVFLGCLMIIGIIAFDNGSISIGLDLDPKYTAGNMIALLSGVAYGLFLFFCRYRTDVPSDVRAFYNFLFAFLTIGAYLVINGSSITHQSPTSWMWLIATAFFTGFIAFYLLTIAAKYLQAAELACISYQETIMATVLGMALFTEELSFTQGVGGFLIVAGGIFQIIVSVKNTSTGKIDDMLVSTSGAEVIAGVETPEPEESRQNSTTSA